MHLVQKIPELHSAIEIYLVCDAERRVSPYIKDR